MKNILVISGSQRKQGSGIKAFNMLKSYFNEDEYKFEVLHLADYKIEYCKGCTVCFKTKIQFCPNKDDVSSIVEKMKVTDGIVFISPIYEMNISGQMKTFFDRIAYLLHRPSLYDKHAYLIFSADAGGIKLVTLYMKYLMNAFGMNTAGSFGVYSKPLQNNEKYRNELLSRLEKESVKFKNALSLGGHYKPKFSQLLRFNGWKIKNTYSKDVYPEDYLYWKENGWLESDYYYPVELSKICKFFLRIVKSILTKVMAKKLS